MAGLKACAASIEAGLKGPPYFLNSRTRQSHLRHPTYLPYLPYPPM